MEGEPSWSRRYEEKDFWNQWYNERGGASLEWTAPANDLVLSRVESAIGKVRSKVGGRKLRLCELGCGTSSFAVALASDAVEVVGVDFSEEAISCNKQRHPDIEWVCCDALNLSDHFQLGSFDVIVAKTLLDCFLTFEDAEGSVRRLFKQIRGVLSDDGFVLLFDRGRCSQYIHTGQVEELFAGSRSIHCRTLSAARSYQESDMNAADGGNLRWELEVPPIGKHLVTIKSAGSGVVTIWTADDAALAVGLKSGDRLLGVDFQDGKGMRCGDASFINLGLRQGGKQSGPVRLLIERPAAGTAMRHSVKSCSRLESRRLVSQSEFLLRQRTARLRAHGGTVPDHVNTDAPKLRKSRSSPQLPRMDQADRISTQVCVAKGLFC